MKWFSLHLPRTRPAKLATAVAMVWFVASMSAMVMHHLSAPEPMPGYKKDVALAVGFVAESLTAKERLPTNIEFEAWSNVNDVSLTYIATLPGYRLEGWDGDHLWQYDSETKEFLLRSSEQQNQKNIRN